MNFGSHQFLSCRCKSLLILSHSSIIIGSRQFDVFVRFIESPCLGYLTVNHERAILRPTDEQGESMKNVAITGIGGYLGGLLLDRLGKEDEV